MLPVGNFLNHLFAECRKIIRLSAGNEIAIHHHFFVHPIGARILEIGL